MFVDYSGLERYSIINEKFGNKYLQLLRFHAIQSPEDRLKELKENSNGLESVQAVRLEDFKMHCGIIDYIFKMLLCITQMHEVASHIRRCPTVYFVEMFNQPCPMSRYLMENFSLSLLNMYCEVQKAYDDIKNELLEEVKILIAELKPDYGSRNFERWHFLQKCLYFECFKDLEDNMIPQTHIVSIPMNFPNLYKEQVNRDGFMRESAQVCFFMFDTLSAERSLDPISADELKLKAVGDKVSTVWEDINDNTSIESDTERTASSEGSNRSSRTGSAVKEPDLVELFKELDINVDIERSSARFDERRETIGSKSKDEELKFKECLQYSDHRDRRFTAEMISSIGKRTSSPISPILEEDEDESEADNLSSDNGKENEVFSPVNSGNRCTALTDNNDCSSSISPLPLDSSPKAFKDFNVHQSKREAMKEKFKEYVGRPIQKCFTRNSNSLGFETIDSIAEFEGWDEVTSRKFIKFKLKKFKRDCRYYKQIAKRFFEDIHESSHGKL
ncbi:hypothetical protein HG537_0B06190 [Torulaspora globosa]|uniref:Uncharacterized protein n=1 Tax=Torulaspora globosa TaxID=48254 RepID=A0A7H9HPG6_9SACH|nr:hypothetical protein HG537_0B06110 [Torulaspora sp. CBS 2947]QLQ79271.1 hypothetical protein HG537_0B06190 [Torulaspora sp. CBS 2947]